MPQTLDPVGGPIFCTWRTLPSCSRWGPRKMDPGVQILQTPEIFGPLSSMCLTAGGEILLDMRLLMKEVTVFRKLTVALLSCVWAFSVCTNPGALVKKGFNSVLLLMYNKLR